MPGLFILSEEGGKMKVRDFLKSLKEPFFSLEFVPPMRGSSIEEITKVIDKLMVFSPKFINVTNHPIDIEYVEMNDKIVKVPVNKRPGTIGMATAMKQRYPEVEVIPHLVCAGQSKYQLEDTLIELSFLGIENVFVIRGDIENVKNKGAYFSDDEWHYAKELLKQISDMNKGKYLYPIENAAPTEFCVGIAGYPEKHYESLNLYENILHLKEKVDAGADYVITQMFFDFDVYKNFVELAREVGIDVPIVPGIKPVVSLKSLKSIPKRFFVDIPQELVELMKDARSSKEEWKNGIKYMSKLTEKLLNYGAPGIHIFTMGHGKSTYDLLKLTFGKIVNG